jgi:hypothetical protein
VCEICGRSPLNTMDFAPAPLSTQSRHFDRERLRPAVRTMSWRNSTVIGMVALAWGSTAFADPHELHRSQRQSQRDVTAVSPPAIQLDIERPATGFPLGIAKVRFDPPPPGEKDSSAVLKFQISNRSSSTLTDIVVEVSIVEELRRGHLDTRKRVLAGPFAIRGTIVLDAGYTADYEILLRNMSPTCRCAAKVRVVSFRSIEDLGP